MHLPGDTPGTPAFYSNRETQETVPDTMWDVQNVSHQPPLDHQALLNLHCEQLWITAIPQVQVKNQHSHMSSRTIRRALVEQFKCVATDRRIWPDTATPQWCCNRPAKPEEQWQCFWHLEIQKHLPSSHLSPPVLFLLTGRTFCTHQDWQGRFFYNWWRWGLCTGTLTGLFTMNSGSRKSGFNPLFVVK